MNTSFRLPKQGSRGGAMRAARLRVAAPMARFSASRLRATVPMEHFGAAGLHAAAPKGRFGAEQGAGHEMHGAAVLTQAAHLFALMAVAFALAVCGLLLASQPAHAASGQVYSGTLERCYKHPVTGVIEDSGGQKSYATGQGMVEGCLGSSCMMEETTDGKYYLTIRLSLIDYTSKRSFKVQKWGASGWSSTTYGVTKKGKNDDGTTYDYCIQVPSQNAIVRMTMYVTPMGRSVICYFYAKDLKKGKPSSMTATIVTSSGSVKNNTSSNASTSSNAKSTQKAATSSKAANSSDSSDSTDDSDSSGSSSSDASDASSASTDSSSSSTDLSGAGVNSAQGLDLSTASSSTSSSDDAGDGGDAGSLSQGQLFATVMGAVVAGGVVLIAIAAGVVYYFRRHWAQWNTADPDNYEKAYQDSLASAAGGAPTMSSAERAAQTVSSAERAAQAVSATDPTQQLDAVMPDGAANQGAQSEDAAQGGAATSGVAPDNAVPGHGHGVQSDAAPGGATPGSAASDTAALPTDAASASAASDGEDLSPASGEREA